MHENVLATIALDKAVALRSIEPLHNTGFLHSNLILAF
jgi:hypothetical protein